MSELIHIGNTPDGKPVLGGAFQLADTSGLPLWAALEHATKRGAVISLPHYFASAIERGWDDRMTFAKMQEAISDAGIAVDFDAIRRGCMALFMEAAADGYAGSGDTSRKMRLKLEGR